jgi:hypothetical protein
VVFRAVLKRLGDGIQYSLTVFGVNILLVCLE